MTEFKCRMWCPAMGKYVMGDMVRDGFDGKFCATFRTYPCVIEFWTGMKDKDSKDIYVGDIVRHNDNMAVIEFSAPEFCPDLVVFGKHPFWGFDGEHYWYWEALTVVGNINENGDLLK